MKIQVPVISTTHYDREWRFSLQQTRSMLVDLMDHLLEILDKQDNFRCYHLDSQSVILEDYLSLRPEKETDLRRLVSAGRLLAGPWYSLPDMNLVAGESIIRNLLLGHKVAGAFGPVPKVGYTPTGFGHISQLPQIYNGFGIDTAMFYRGPDRSKVEKEFIWCAPDGSEVIAYIFTPEFGRMPLYHCITRRVLYGQAFYERNHPWNSGEGPFRLEDERTRWNLYYQSNIREVFETTQVASETQRMIETELRDSHLETFLCIDGTDSTEPQPLTPRLLVAMNAACETHEFVHTDLEAFAKVLRQARPKLKTFQGEMHTASNKGVQTNLFGDTISTRTDLKQYNASVENQLMAWAEPFSILAWLQGAEYPSMFLDEAWKYLLNNQSHDCIAGCGQDIVHDDMVYYFRQASEIADEITRKSLFHLAGQIDTGQLGESEVLLLIFNPSPHQRDGIVEMRVDLPSKLKAPGIRVRALSGEDSLFEVTKTSREMKVLIHRPKDAPGTYTMDSWWIRLDARKIPPLGWKTLVVETSPEPSPISMAKSDSQEQVIENEIFRLSLNKEGCFDLTEKTTGRVFRGLNRFEDRGEVGDAYFSIPPETDRVIHGPKGVFHAWSETGKVSSSITIEFQLEIPESTEPGGRSSVTRLVTVSTTATLHRGSSQVYFRTEVNNCVRDHRLRVLFPSGIPASMSVSDMPFDFPERPIQQPDTTGWFERGYPNHPMRHFCAVSSDELGLAVMTRGLPEYEVYDDLNRTIAVTLLRTSRVKTPKLKAVDQAQQGTQQLGKQVFEYAVRPFRSGLEEVYRAALDYCIPLRAGQSGRQKGSLPMEMSFLSVPSPFSLTALKRSESGQSLILRVWNTSARECGAEIVFGFPVREVWETNLAEERKDKIQLSDNMRVCLRAHPRQILTLELVPLFQA